jgi:Tol biopolymer transport system component
MYESHDFSPSGDELLFSGNLEKGQEEVHGDIYLYNMKTSRLTNLTQSPNDWDEHAHFSPDGKTIVWMTSKGLPDSHRAAGVATDYWMMNADGSNKRRLTYFNTPGHPESMKGGVVAADFAWSPDGSKIAAYLITDVRTGGKVVMIDLLQSKNSLD